MANDEILNLIRDHRKLVQLQAERSLRKEQELALRPESAARISYLRNLLALRQRDYRTLIRASEIAEKRLAEGKTWKAQFRRVRTMDAALIKLSVKLDKAMLSPLSNKVKVA